MKESIHDHKKQKMENKHRYVHCELSYLTLWLYPSHSEESTNLKFWDTVDKKKNKRNCYLLEVLGMCRDGLVLVMEAGMMERGGEFNPQQFNEMFSCTQVYQVGVVAL